MDIFGRVWAVILAVMVMFITPVAIFAQKQDVTVQNYVDDAAHEFIDISRSTGYIAESSYDRLINRLDNTGNVYDIKLTHYKERQYPVFESGEVVDYDTGYDIETTDTVLGIIYGTYEDEEGNAIHGENAEHRYSMSSGDYIKIEIKNTNPTLGRRFMSLLFMRPAEGGQIFTSYGGYVGNEA